MIENHNRCSRVSDTKKCPNCYSSKIVKNGTTKTKKQQYFCKNCNKRFLDFYSYQAYRFGIDNDIVALTKEGTGIRSTARLLKISPTTLLARIITIAKNIVQPSIPKGKTYQVDEMRTYVKRKDKLIWIVYALEKQTKNVVSFSIGRRTNKTLKKVITSLELSEAEKIITDNLKNYKFLIRPEIHSTKFRGINHIERKNLTLRTHLKRLNRKTICFSKSLVILSAILKIYFWG
ncbi:IS1 family transposase [Chryseobacterium sp. EO14]|uniref:IS1 family transposase n=1 Tax=Chryseobacterium sp. EO14 TaxID=2950551 RepID=UPI002108C2BE|nr:IS1 family transposase [Chryseobacterium sp. EO14]MCQ4142564.1 IS1 family transposase [Chryseobacterium sp. EO14]